MFDVEQQCQISQQLNENMSMDALGTRVLGAYSSTLQGQLRRRGQATPRKVGLGCEALSVDQSRLDWAFRPCNDDIA